MDTHKHLRIFFVLALIVVILSITAKGQPLASQKLAVVAYYPQWSVCDMPPQKLDWTAFTHLIYFFGEPTTTPPYFNIYAGSSDSACFETGIGSGSHVWCTNPSGRTHQQIILDSARAHNVKLILCVGGEYGNPASVFSAMIADTAPGGKQDQFINAALGFVKRHGYNGIDVNWEFPDNSVAGRANFDRFCYKVRSILNSWTFADGSHGIFTMANPFWFWWNHSTKSGPVVNVRTINETMDFTDLEMYGMENTGKVSEYSPLYNNPLANQEYWDFRGPKEYLDAGILPSKIVTLMPFECLSMSASSSVIGSAASSPSWIGLRDIPAAVLANPIWDPVALTSYGYAAGKVYLFETQSSINEKVKYAIGKGIGGVGIWELWRGFLPSAPAGQQSPLLSYLKAAVSGAAPPPPPGPALALSADRLTAAVGQLITYTASISPVQICDSIVFFRSAIGDTGKRAGASIRVSSAVSSWMAPAPGSWSTYAVAYIAGKAYASSILNIQATDTTTVPAFFASISASAGTIVSGSPVTITGTANAPFSEFHLWLHNKFYARDLAPPVTFTIAAGDLRVGKDTVSGYVMLPSGSWFTLNQIILTVVAPLPAVCNLDSATAAGILIGKSQCPPIGWPKSSVDSAYAAGILFGKAGMFTKGQLDSTWNAALDAVPPSITNPVTFVVPKPAKRP